MKVRNNENLEKEQIIRHFFSFSFINDEKAPNESAVFESVSHKFRL